MSKKKLKDKIPKIGIAVSADSVRAENVDYLTHRFVWEMSDQFLDYDHEKYGWKNVLYHDFCKRAGIMRKLLEFETKKWGECEIIAGSPHHKSWHPIEYGDFPRKERQYLEKKYLDKVDCFYQLSLSGKERIIGYKKNEIFYPIWYDQNHDLFKGKK